MYRIIDINILKDRAINFCKEERSKYIPYLTKAKDFAIENNFYVLDKLQLSELEAYNYTFFSVRANKFARLLADNLFDIDPTGLSRYTRVTTVIPNYLFSVVVNEREICLIYDIIYYRGIALTEIIETIYIDNIKYIGYEIHMAYLCEKMYNPANKSKWPHIFTQLVEYNDDVTGSGSGSDIDKYKINKNVLAIIQKHNIDVCIVGDIALALMKGHKINNGRLQLVSTDIEKTYYDLWSHLNKDSSIMTNKKIDVKFVIDVRLVRLTVYINDISVIDIFNSAEYEVFQYEYYSGLKVASLFLCLKLKLTDMWMIKLLKHLNNIKEDYFISTYANMQKCFKELYSLLPDYFPTIDQNTQYYGIFRDYNIEMKRKTSENGMFYSPYYPLKANN